MRSLLMLLPLLLAWRPTQGVLQPQGDVATEERAAALESNPAGLAFSDPLELSFTLVEAKRQRLGQGQAFFGAFGLLDPYHMGLGFQLLNPPGAQEHAPLKFGWGHALRLGSSLSLGFNWSYFFADEDPLLDGLESWDLGFQLRPSRWLAVGLNIRDLSSPLHQGRLIQRGYDFALALRPGTEALSLSASLRSEEGGMETPWYGGGFKLQLWGALSLSARYEHHDGVQRLFLGLLDSALGLGFFGYSADLSKPEGRDGFAVHAEYRSEGSLDPYRSAPLVVEVSIGASQELGPAPLLGGAPSTPFLTLLQDLRHLSRREDVDGVLLTFGEGDLGWAQAHELRRSIQALRDAGKVVYAWLPFGDTRNYSIAVRAERIYAPPAGALLLTGVKGQFWYLRDLLDSLGIQAEFVASGGFKTAPEMFTRSGPSQNAARMEEQILDNLYEMVIQEIMSERGLKEETVKAIIDGGPYSVQAAEKAQLLDELIHYDEFDRIFRERFGASVRFLELSKLERPRDQRWGSQPAIGLLFIVGEITGGESLTQPTLGHRTTGAHSFLQALRSLREDPRVKAVVLRIDSPGGSASASDTMWRELSRLAQEKPLIVSMGDVAASGGYYAAVPAQEILVSPQTITGSIGVFGGKFNLSGLYKKLGVKHLLFSRGRNAAILSHSKPWSPEERIAYRSLIEALDDLFHQRVAESREGLGLPEVEALASGRVWMGDHALACGLVDREAGFLTAIDLAVLAAGLGEGDYRLLLPPEKISLRVIPELPALGRLLGELVQHPFLLHPSGEALARLPWLSDL